MSNKCAVVTGANGFIGRNLVISLLKKDYFVYAIVTEEESLKDLCGASLKQVKLFFEDYCKLTSIIDRSVDIFYHCAWQGVWGKAFEDYSLQMNNAINSGKTMEIASLLNAKKFVLISTVNVLETKKVILEPEKYLKLRATTNYSMAKISAEMICRTLSSSNGVEFNCAYIAMVYGEGNYSLMVPNVVIKKLLHDISPDLIEGNGLYDLIYVKDVADGLLAIGERGKNLISYYLGQRKLQTFKDIFTEVGIIVNKDVKMNFGAYPDANYIDYSLVDLDALYRDTGFETSHPFKDSILSTSKWIKEKLGD